MSDLRRRAKLAVNKRQCVTFSLKKLGIEALLAELEFPFPIDQVFWRWFDGRSTLAAPVAVRAIQMKKIGRGLTLIASAMVPQ